MSKKPKRWGLLFYAAFTGLSVITAALVVVSVQFFTSAPVQIYTEEWTEDLLVAPTEQPAAYVSSIAYSQGFAESLKSGLEEPEALEISRTLEPTSTAPPPEVSALRAPIGDLVIDDPTPEELAREAKLRKPAGPKGELIIPALNVFAQPQWVSVKNGQWDISTLHDQVGWLETTGTYPEDELAMVFIGHVTLPYPGGAGPFLYLSQLRVGDEISYRDGSWVYVYQIEKREAVGPDEVEAVYIRDKYKLALITCTSWNPVTRQYDRRLLLEASLDRLEPAPAN